MACFNAWDIGDCGCICSACATANTVTLAPYTSCCVCNQCVTGSTNVIATLNSSVGGNTSFPMTYTPSPATWTAACSPDGSGGSFVISFISGTYWKIQVKHYSGVSCTTPTATYNINATGTDLTSYQCNPSFSATFQVTATNCSWLFGLGVTAITMVGMAADPLCVTGCSTCAHMPLYLYVTDSNGGPYTAFWDGTGYYTSELQAGSKTPVADCPAGTCHTGSQAGTPGYTYGIYCIGSNQMAVERYWSELFCSSPTFQYGKFGCSGLGHGTVSSYRSETDITVTCGALSWSGTLAKKTGNMADPVGGTVSFTQ